MFRYTKEIENIEKELREAEERAKQKKELAKVRAGKQLLDNVLFFEKKLESLGVQVGRTMVDMQREEVEQLAEKVAKKLIVAAKISAKETTSAPAKEAPLTQEKLPDKKATNSFLSNNDTRKNF